MGPYDFLNTKIIPCHFIPSFTLSLLLLLSSPGICIGTINISLSASLLNDGFTYNLTLNCTAPGTPSNVSIQRKFPLGPIDRVVYRNLGSSAGHEVLLVQGKDCNDFIGTYDCTVLYKNHSFKSKGLNVQIPNCPFKMCSTNENNTIVHAAVNETVNITFCIFGNVIGMTGKIQNNRERRLLNYVFISEVNNVTLKNFMRVSLIRPSTPENFGLYKLEVTQTNTKVKLFLHVHLIKKEIPQFCNMSKNFSVVNVIKNVTTAKFCVISKDPIYRISVNDQILLLNGSYMDSSMYKLGTDTEHNGDNSSQTYSLQVLNVTVSATHQHQVNIETIFNMSLRFNLHLMHPENHIVLCNETINNTLIDLWNRKPVIHFCVVTKENITDVLINEMSLITTAGLASNQKYILTNKSQGGVINFTLEVNEFHETRLHNYTVRILTKSGLGILYAFRVHNSAQSMCSSTNNATILDIINNTATVCFCFNKNESVSEIIVDQTSQTEGFKSLEYRHESQELQERRLIKITMYNISSTGPHVFQVKLVAASGTRFYYVFYGENQNGKKFHCCAYQVTLVTITVPVISVCLIAFACFGLCCYRRLKARRRRDSFEEKYAEFVNEGHFENNGDHVKIRQAQNDSNMNLQESKADLDDSQANPSLQTLLDYQPSSIYEHVL